MKKFLVYLCFAFVSLQARAETVDELKSYIKDLEKRIEKIEKQGKQEKKSNTNSTNLDFGKVSIGGYIKVDLLYDMGVRAGDSVFLPTISTNEEHSKGDKTRIHARESRLNVAYNDKSQYGDVKGFIEVDFYGTKGEENIANGDGLRLRQAYGEVGNFLFGQTWTNFVDLDSMPDTLDFGYPEGMSATRQAQFRYTIKKNKWQTSFAIENPESDFIDSNGNSGETTGEKSDPMPDFTFLTKYSFNSGHLALAGVYRQIGADDGFQSDKVNAYGIAVSGLKNVYNKDNFKFRFSYGDGIGRYIRDAYKYSASLNQNNYKLDAQTAYGFYVGYQHFWLDNLKSSLIYGLTEIDNNTEVIGTDENKRLETIHANLIYSLEQNIELGVEYIFGKRELDNGEAGYVRRIQFSTKLKF